MHVDDRVYVIHNFDYSLLVLSKSEVIKESENNTYSPHSSVCGYITFIINLPV